MTATRWVARPRSSPSSSGPPPKIMNRSSCAGGITTLAHWLHFVDVGQAADQLRQCRVQRVENQRVRVAFAVHFAAGVKEPAGTEREQVRIEWQVEVPGD